VGELDVAGVPLLRAALDDLNGDIEIDCSGLTFIDCSGLGVLQQAQCAFNAKGVSLCLIAPSRWVTRLLDLAGLDRFFDVRNGSSP
jgi:anti-anti-sigma factor